MQLTFQKYASKYAFIKGVSELHQNWLVFNIIFTVMKANKMMKKYAKKLFSYDVNLSIFRDVNFSNNLTFYAE